MLADKRNPSGVAAFERDIEETVNEPFARVWQVQMIDRAPEGWAFHSYPMSFAEALRMIAEIGRADSPKGPRLLLEVTR